MPKQQKTLFFFAGEPSGDLHGKSLIEHLNNQNTFDLKIEGVGGPLMRASGLKCLLPSESFAVMGFTDVFFSLPKLLKQFYRVRNYILTTAPDAVILIDYPGFNLRLAKALRKKNFKGKIIQYICPTVWAWGKSRIQTMCDSLDLLLTIYPFETKIFSKTSLQALYAGHPLENIAKQPVENRIKTDRPLIALFPGSRKGEIIRNFPKQLSAAANVQSKNPDILLAVSVSDENMKPLIEDVLKKQKLVLDRDVVLVPKNSCYDLMRKAACAIAKSGTVTLELALQNCPTIVVYEVTKANYFLAKYVFGINLTHYCIVNILAGETVFPELIASSFTVQNVENCLEALYSDENARRRSFEGCQKVKEILSQESGRIEAKTAILELL